MTSPRHDPHSWHTKALVIAVYGLFVVVALALWGCSTTRTVRIPAGASTIRVEVPEDTARLEALPPIELRGSLTHPDEVLVIGDTSAPTVDVSLLEVDRTDPDRQQVRLRVEQGAHTVEKRFSLPTVGEGLRVRVDTAYVDTSASDTPPLRESVFGTPSDYTVQADVAELEPPWWEKLWGGVRLLVAFVGGVAFGYVAVKLLPGV